MSKSKSKSLSQSRSDFNFDLVVLSGAVTFPSMAGLRSAQEPLILPGFTWEQYQAVAESFSGSGVSVRFLDEVMELRAPVSEEHEERRSLLRRLVESWCFHRGIRLFFRNQSTMLLPGEAGGAPDEAYCIGEKKELPDLVVEVALTSGGLSHRGFYQRFAIPELWIWRHGVLEVFCWDGAAGRYEASAESHTLPDLDLRLVAECARMHNASDALAVFRKRIGA